MALIERLGSWTWQWDLATKYRSNSPANPTTGLRWALALVSVVAVAAAITAVTLWLNPRHVEQAPPSEKASTGVPRADLEQITGQNLRLQYPGPPVPGSPAPVIYRPRLAHPRTACSGDPVKISA